VPLEEFRSMTSSRIELATFRLVVRRSFEFFSLSLEVSVPWPPDTLKHEPAVQGQIPFRNVFLLLFHFPLAGRFSFVCFFLRGGRLCLAPPLNFFFLDNCNSAPTNSNVISKLRVCLSGHRQAQNYVTYHKQTPWPRSASELY
jgi:hypothetical protein